MSMTGFYRKGQMGSSASFGGSGNSGAYDNSSEVFSTDLYTGNGSSVAVANSVNLSGQGGLVILKGRNPTGTGMSTGAAHSEFFDTVRGGTKLLECGGSRSSGGETTVSNSAAITFNSTGFTVGDDSDNKGYNQNTGLYVAHTFRKARKFFDIRTYTGNGSNQAIAHSLDCEVGMIWIKRINASGTNWIVYHRENTTASDGSTYNAHRGYTYLNSLLSFTIDSTLMWNDTAPTTTHFTVGNDVNVNGSGDTYVAYLFAHNTDVDSIIKCGSFTTGSNVLHDGQYFDTEFGFEPTYVLMKGGAGAEEWNALDEKRGMGYNGYMGDYRFSSAGANETWNNSKSFVLMDKGFLLRPGSNTNDPFYNSTNYIYMIIKRTMAEATDVTGTLSSTTGSTNVFFPSSRVVSSSTQPSFTNNGLGTNLAPEVDMTWHTNGSYITMSAKRLGNGTLNVSSANDVSDNTQSTYVYSANSTLDSTTHGFGRNMNATAKAFGNWKRATGFFDLVIYKGSGSNQAVDHNLGAVPKMMLIKRIGYGPSSATSTANNYWQWYHADVGNTKYFQLGRTEIPFASSSAWNNTSPTATQFTVGSGSSFNGGNELFMAILFGEISGVSKVGQYTGTGTSATTIDCGFTNGIDFLITKNITSYDDAHMYTRELGITTSAGADTTVKIKDGFGSFVTSDDSIQQHNTGFTLMPNVGSNINGSKANKLGESYVYYAIANST